jgi:hypothetical protein
MLAYLFLALLVKAEAEHARLLGTAPARRPPALVETPRVPQPVSTPWPGQMSFFSVYCGPTRDRLEEETIVTCRLRRAINNLDQKVVITGEVYQDVIDGAGRVLVPAGSKLVGQGFCDPEQGRILGRGCWTIYLSDHEIRVQGTLLDATRKEGLAGEENEIGPNIAKIKQAIYRDGRYLYVPLGTEFILKLFGNASVADLGSAFDE